MSTSAAKTSNKEKKKRVRASRAKDPTNPVHRGRFTSDTAREASRMGGGRPLGSGTKYRMAEFAHRMMGLLEDGIEAAGNDAGAVGAMAWLFKKHPALYVQLMGQLLPNRVDITIDEQKTTTLEFPSLNEVREKIKEYGLPIPTAFPVVDFTKKDDGTPADVVDVDNVDSDVSDDEPEDRDDDPAL